MKTELTRTQIGIKWGSKKSKDIITAYHYTYRSMSFTVRKHKSGERPWTLSIDGVSFFGFNMTHSYTSRAIAVAYAQKQINNIVGKSVKSILAEVF